MASGDATPLTSSPILQATAAVVTLGTGSVSSVTQARVRSVIWRSGAQPNYAELELVGMRFEEMAQITPNTPVSITLRYAGGDVVLFVGRITGRTAEYSANEESLSLVCLGPRWDLAKDYVHGREMLTFDPASGSPSSPAPVCILALPCVFNANSRGNLLRATFVAGGALTVEPLFHSDARVVPAAENEWTVALAVAYIYRQRLQTRRREYGATPAANVVGHPLGALEAVGLPQLITTKIYDLNVDGMSLSQAIDTVLASGGFHWWIKPVRIGTSGPEGELKATLKRFTDGVSVAKQLSLPAIPAGRLPAATVANPSLSTSSRRPDHNRGLLNEDFSRVVSQVAAFGGPATLQAEFDLVAGWRTKDEVALSAVSGSTFEKVKYFNRMTTEATSSSWNPDPDPTVPYYRDVGRLFLLNETGNENDRGGGPFDWKKDGTPLGLAAPVSFRPRPFQRELKERPFIAAIAASAGGVDGSTITQRVLPAKLEVEHPDNPVVSGSKFVEPAYATWALEPERAGLRITNTVITVGPFFNDKTLTWATRARLGLAIESDWLLAASHSAEGALVLARGMVKADREYQDINSTVMAALAALATRRLEVNAVPVRSASFTIPWITPAYEPGHWISGIAGRDLSWIGQIHEVRFDFAAQDTHITLEDLSIFVGAMA